MNVDVPVFLRKPVQDQRCPYCHERFAKRGLPRHRVSCRARPQVEAVADPEPEIIEERPQVFYNNPPSPPTEYEYWSPPPVRCPRCGNTPCPNMLECGKRERAKRQAAQRLANEDHSDYR